MEQTVILAASKNLVRLGKILLISLWIFGGKKSTELQMNLIAPFQKGNDQGLIRSINKTITAIKVLWLLNMHMNIRGQY